MPLPRKNVTSHVRNHDERHDILVTNRKPSNNSPPVFDWEDDALGIQIPLSTSDSDYSDFDNDQQRFLSITPKAFNNVKKSNSKKSAKSSNKSPKKQRNSEAQNSTNEWVRNLIECRKEKFHKVAPDEHGFRTTGRGWLMDQHKALEEASIPVTFKCIVAASGISDLYNKCRDDFMKPEYRSRYWSWSLNFVLLIDYYIDYGNIDVSDKSPEKYHPLIAFLAQCKSQKNTGSLSAQRDQLLTGMGLVWDIVEEEIEEEEDPGESSDSSADSQGEDETWEMPSKSRVLPTRKRRHVKKRVIPKRKRPSTAGSSAKGKPVTTVVREESPPPVYIYRPTPPPTRDALRAWAKKIYHLRNFYKKKRSFDDDSYDIPASRVSLRIWMNAEVARCNAGVLSEVCKGILLAAEMADLVEVDHLSAECEKWGKGFVAYIDFMLRKGKMHDVVVDFLHDCRRWSFNGVLPTDRDALLCGVDEGWLQSKQMKTAVFEKDRQRSRIDRMKQMTPPSPVHMHEFETLDSYDSNGNVIEVIIDSESELGEHEANKRRKTDTLVRQMLTSMIGGEVAVTVEGRNPTEAERHAKEWVLSAGAKAFDVYAKNWFRAAISE